LEAPDYVGSFLFKFYIPNTLMRRVEKTETDRELHLGWKCICGVFLKTTSEWP